MEFNLRKETEDARAENAKHKAKAAGVKHAQTQKLLVGIVGAKRETVLRMGYGGWREETQRALRERLKEQLQQTANEKKAMEEKAKEVGSKLMISMGTQGLLRSVLGAWKDVLVQKKVELQQEEAAKAQELTLRKTA